jgi:hypothetical protein
MTQNEAERTAYGMPDNESLAYLQELLLMLRRISDTISSPSSQLEDLRFGKDVLKRAFEHGPPDFFVSGDWTQDFVFGLDADIESLGRDFKTSPFLEEFDRKLSRVIDKTRQEIEFYKDRIKKGSV